MSDRRQQILDAARLLFHQYGPHKTTVGDIARAAGIGVGTVYLEFRSKDAILLALSEAGHTRVLQATRAAWQQPGAYDERLRRALEARLLAFLEPAEASLHGADLLHCGGCAPVQQAHRAFCEAEHAQLTELLSEGAAAGAFACRDAAATARALLLAYDAFSPPALLLRRAKLGLSSEQLVQQLRQLHELVFPGLLVR